MDIKSIWEAFGEGILDSVGDVNVIWDGIRLEG